MSDREKNITVNSLKYFLWVITIIATIVLIIFFVFNRGISHDPVVWGQFGDYFGGILNPIVGILTMFAIYFTYMWQVSESDKNSKSLQYQMFESTFFKILDLHT